MQPQTTKNHNSRNTDLLSLPNLGFTSDKDLGSRGGYDLQGLTDVDDGLLDTKFKKQNAILSTSERGGEAHKGKT